MHQEYVRRTRRHTGRDHRPSLHRKTIYQVSHVERLSKGLQQILAIEFGRQVDLRICCATVAAGTSLSRHVVGDNVLYMGLPWSTSAALRHLAGRGFVFSPGEALAALNRLEARHIIDRRRLEYRDGRGTRRSQPCGDTASPSRKTDRVGETSIQTAQPIPAVRNKRFVLGYVRCR